jgi:hypothetical protein
MRVWDASRKKNLGYIIPYLSPSASFHYYTFSLYQVHRGRLTHQSLPLVDLSTLYIPSLWEYPNCQSSILPVQLHALICCIVFCFITVWWHPFRSLLHLESKSRLQDPLLQSVRHSTIIGRLLNVAFAPIIVGLLMTIPYCSSIERFPPVSSQPFCVYVCAVLLSRYSVLCSYLCLFLGSLLLMLTILSCCYYYLRRRCCGPLDLSPRVLHIIFGT